jgi:hypothetical protein
MKKLRMIRRFMVAILPPLHKSEGQKTVKGADPLSLRNWQIHQNHLKQAVSIVFATVFAKNPFKTRVKPKT